MNHRISGFRPIEQHNLVTFRPLWPERDDVGLNEVRVRVERHGCGEEALLECLEERGVVEGRWGNRSTLSSQY